MKQLLIITLLLFLCGSLPVFAVTVNSVLYPLQDTYNSNGGGGGVCNAAIANTTAPHGGESTLAVTCNAAGAGSWNGYWMYNVSLLRRMIIISNATFSVNKAIAQCSSSAFNIQVSYNTTWNESAAVYTLTSAGNVGSLSVPNIATGVYRMTISSLTPAWIQLLYNSSDDLVSFQSVETSLSCSNSGDIVYFTSKEGSSTLAGNWNFSLSDFATGTVYGTLGLLTPNTYFDFESQTASSSSFPEADFVWNRDTNILTPYAPANKVSTEYDTSNTLTLVSCGGLTFSNSDIGSINVPSGGNDIICFDLKNSHGGRSYFGAIKIFTNNASNFEFHYALYPPSRLSTTAATFDPAFPEAEKNLTVSWSSTPNMTTGFRFRFIQSGAFTSWATIQDLNITETHTVTIPSNLMFATLYEYQFFGKTADGVDYVSQIANFTAYGSFSSGSVSGNTTVFFDFETGRSSGTWFYGADFMLDTIHNVSEFYTSGIIFNGTLSPYAPKSFITFEPTSDNTLQNLDCHAAPSYDLNRALYLNPALEQGSYPVFCFDLSSQHDGQEIFGAIKITQMTMDGASKFYYALYTSDFVTFYSITKNPVVPLSDQPLTISWQTSIPLSTGLQYSYKTVNDTAFSPFYGYNDATLSASHSATIPASQMKLGSYQFYFSGIDENNKTYASPMFNFTVTASSPVGASVSPVADFLGIDIKSLLAVIALLITIGATVAVQIYGKAPAVSAIVFTAFLITFVVLTWLPLIFAVILGVLALFIGVKIAADIMAGRNG